MSQQSHAEGTQRTQREKLIDRLTSLLDNNPSRAIHLTVIVDERKQPLTWYVDEPLKLESRQQDKPKDGV